MDREVMECDQCGQRGDWLGDHSDWEPVTSASTARGLYECRVCGHRQRNR